MADVPEVAEIKYEYLDHTADIQLHGWGKTLEEAVEQTVISMYGYMTEISSVSTEYSFDLFATGIDMISLIARLLDEALYAFSTEPFFIAKIAKIIKLDREKFEVHLRCWGESFDLNKHPQGTEVKAITYSNMQINESSDKTDIYINLHSFVRLILFVISSFIMANVEKRVFKRKLKKLQDAAKPKLPKTDKEDAVNEKELLDEKYFCFQKEEEAKKESRVECNPSVDVGSYLSSTTFESLSGVISKNTLQAVAEMGFSKMTEIQARCMNYLLEVILYFSTSAKTGSGKTLAFLIPAVELLMKLEWKARNGTGVIVISPTRELSMQIYGVLSELLAKHPSLTHGLIMGGANRSAEALKLGKGVSFLVATPGRLLDHLQNTDDFMVKNLKCLIIDEADRILDIGFEIEMQHILRLLPKKRQTMFFSATRTPKVDELIKAALSADPVRIDVGKMSSNNENELATVSGLEQGYVVCPSEKRFLLLFTFLKKNRNKKVMVFFSSCNSVKYHHELLNYIDIPVQCIHGKQKQQKRTCTFFSFCQAASGILLCTDVAARGLDIPQVDWIVQYDPPDEPREYIHRVGRTARGATGTGHALLILRPEELGFLRYLKQANVVLNEYEFSWNKVSNIQLQLEHLVESNYYLNKSAKEAYKCYVRAYDSHSLKSIYDVNTLDLNTVAKSFGFSVPPFVDLPISKKPKILIRSKLSGAGYRKRPKAFKQIRKR
ncbi:unnamed protein product [Thelazia callipaeda]|uniref:ATP-dependent RNA helicase n=1 Tax=Thelazia callipaeda TaxID=103827 RepID=A0A0N5D4U3_THECL|nr:unnamed protein product [Thelazia callipaeda]